MRPDSPVLAVGMCIVVRHVGINADLWFRRDIVLRCALLLLLFLKPILSILPILLALIMLVTLRILRIVACDTLGPPGRR